MLDHVAQGRLAAASRTDPHFLQHRGPSAGVAVPPKLQLSIYAKTYKPVDNLVDQGS